MSVALPTSTTASEPVAQENDAFPAKVQPVAPESPANLGGYLKPDANPLPEKPYPGPAADVTGHRTAGMTSRVLGGFSQSQFTLPGGGTLGGQPSTARLAEAALSVVTPSL